MRRLSFRRPPRSQDDDRSVDAGDTLVEIMIAVVIIGISAAGILGGLAAVLGSSGTHRSLTTLDAIVKSFAETAKYQIQSQAAALRAARSSWPAPRRPTGRPLSQATAELRPGQYPIPEQRSCRHAGHGLRYWFPVWSDAIGHVQRIATLDLLGHCRHQRRPQPDVSVPFLPAGALPDQGRIGRSRSRPPLRRHSQLAL